MKTGRVWLLSLGLLWAAACAPHISPRGEEALEKKVSCKTARNDIAVLEKERASTAARIRGGARTVMPLTAAVGILRGDYRQRMQVATGKYNEDINKKIAQIKATCKIS